MTQPSLLHRVALATALAAVAAAPAWADEPAETHSSHEQNVGVVTGALIGAAVGGPPGALVGAFGGSLGGRDMGHRHELKQSREEVARLQAALKREQALTAQLRTREQTEAKARAVQVASIAPVALGSSPDVAAAVERGLVLSLQFRTDSAALEPEYRDQLQSLAGVLQALPQTQVEVQGFADRRGAEPFNLKLSQRRADVVRDALVQDGIDAARIHCIGHGEDKPLSSATDPDSLAFERRVLIRFHR